ncbi:unnamed protein product [Urochloa humidicola]
MYFKKAIDEAEEEWSQHEMKKLLTTTACGLYVRENFAYFHVEFGLDHGFVHVIDDESKFSDGWTECHQRDARLDSRHAPSARAGVRGVVDKQKQAGARFMEDWKPFDWTKATWLD